MKSMEPRIKWPILYIVGLVGVVFLFLQDHFKMSAIDHQALMIIIFVALCGFIDAWLSWQITAKNSDRHKLNAQKSYEKRC